MKKIIILLFLIFLTSGCYDYKELNNLAIVSGIAVDFDDTKNEYEITLEILNDNDDSDKIYFVSGNGNTITNAFNDASLKISQIPFYSHVNVMIISKSISKNKINDLIDYIIRNSNITNMFYMVYADGYNAKDIIESNNSQNKVVSESIYQLINNKTLGNNLAIKVPFEEFVSLYLNPMQDIYLPAITLDNNLIKANAVAIFKDNEIINVLDYKDSQALEILLNKNHDAYYDFKCEENKNITIDVFNQKIDYKINKKNNTINVNLKAKVIENECNYNLQNKNDVNYLNKSFNKIIKKDITNLLNNIKTYDTDVLGINYKYYKDYNKKLDFKNENYKIKVNIKINKNGLVYGVKK